MDVSRLSDLEDEIAAQIAVALNRPLGPAMMQRRPRYSKDPMAYAEFIRGYRLSSSGDPAVLDEAAQHLSNAVNRDPAFSLAHAALCRAKARFGAELVFAGTYTGDLERRGGELVLLNRWRERSGRFLQ